MILDNVNDDTENKGSVGPAKKFESTLYKKWFKAGSQSGFISITPWYEARKVSIDIGSVNPDTKAVVSSTKCFIDIIEFGTYLRAIVNGTAEKLYPKRDQCPSPESFLSYGGSGDLSRVFKIHYWSADAESIGTAGSFAFKCGHFGGTVTKTGATIPNFKDRKSANLIKVTLLEMHEISYRVDLAAIRYAVLNPEGITE